MFKYAFITTAVFLSFTTVETEPAFAADEPTVSSFPPASTAAIDRVLSIEEMDRLVQIPEASARWRPCRVSMAPAQWIWLPSQRTLPNTFVLFRREVDLSGQPRKAVGWITADSRYRLTVNGRRVQWGPAPCDPRNLDVDPMDVTSLLRPGKNVLGVEVLYYGHGDGTWPAGKPGMIFNLTIEYEDGRRERIVSDPSWQAMVDRAHRPGQFKRWFLRALQEEFDARLHPFGWDTADYSADADWTAAKTLRCPADKPAACSSYPGNDLIERANPAQSALRMRQIPLLRETDVPAMRLAESGRVQWRRDPADWFEFRMPDSFRIQREPLAVSKGDGVWELPATAGSREGLFAIFEFREQIVGWPHFTIEAPEGTIVELMWQEAHDPAGPAWLDSQFFGWSRFICREGVNRFEAFDYESFRWLQLHVRNAAGPVVVRDVGMRRRTFDWSNVPRIHCSEAPLQRLFDASINTLYNSAQEICADGMGRERQQYSGDGGHQLLAIRSAFGEHRLSARFLRTFSEGLTPEGYFLDCWPAYDRLARVMQRQVDGTFWGPLLDHGVGFNFDCWNHYLETGDLAALDEPYPRLVKFADYLHSIRDQDGLLPVENLGVPQVWIDHIAYRQQRHKQCAFNLYAAAMLEHALAPIAQARGDRRRAEEYARRGRDMLACTVQRFWSPQRGLFVDNLPWLAEEKNPRLSDRALATAILFDQCPEGNTAASLRALAECPAEMGLSYPCNACWRYWALARLGRADVVVNEFRHRWAKMKSVLLNNTIQEDWEVAPDSIYQWSHCAVAPLYVLFGDIAGIRATSPGFASCQIRPQLGDLGDLELTYYTVRGPLRFSAQRQPTGHRVVVRIPAGCEAELLLPGSEGITLPSVLPDHQLGLKRFRLEAGKENEFSVR
ncbi:MAG: alpha-L-rhamnosidase N-terminal domain-containing protein [Planctomycetes bacterium]|nr:alpha-L-rhamnosidase N-terminal domain-containing protein [Planctomycetota bacterium]MBU4399938.1 alpha-L-rhamnosidase N-terminal domain-containing protein [Planctomycetota bacterium]MCG2684168.1 alpha-L-rhamnosidase N-terminal domain-containing protein [Planctomycetales bacterium]